MQRPLDEVDQQTMFNPLSSEFQRCPFDQLAKLRSTHGVYPVPGLPLYLITRYEDCARVLRDTETFSNSYRDAKDALLAVGFLPTDDDVRETFASGIPHMETLIRSDPPQHSRDRRLVNRWFTPRRVAERWMPVIERHVDDLISGFEDRGRIDVVKDYAVPLPVLVIAEVLGLPTDRLRDLRRWSEAHESNIGVRLDHDRWMTSAMGQVELRRFLMEQVEARVGNPTDDLIGSLVQTSLEQSADPDADMPLQLQEVMELVQELLVAGNVTTTQSISETVKQLVQHPDWLERVRADPDQLDPVIEETIRIAGPTIGLFRYVTADAEVGGVMIPQGSLVAVFYGSANHDAAMFEEPDEFRPERPNVHHHMGFGHGIHLCVGAALARAETRVAVQSLLDRLPNLRLAPDAVLSYRDNFLLWRLNGLLVEFDRPHAG